MTVPNVKLWTVYLNYIRRRNDLNNDPSGQARRTITQSYEFVIDNIGVDRDSGNIWQDYVQFVKNGPGQIGGTGWQDQQKMDQLRKIYQRAIAVPMLTVNNLWKEYDQFEMGLNKMTVSFIVPLPKKKANMIRAANSSKNARQATCQPRVPISHWTTSLDTSSALTSQGSHLLLALTETRSSRTKLKCGRNGLPGKRKTHLC